MCGIDFPAGTPGAPKGPASPSDPIRGPRTPVSPPPGEAARTAERAEASRPSADPVAAKLEGALDAELAASARAGSERVETPPASEALQDAGAPSAAPPVSNDDDAPRRAEAAPGSATLDVTPGRGRRARSEPGRAGDGPRAPGEAARDGDAENLGDTSDESQPAADESDLAVTPTRERRLVVAESATRDVVTAPQRGRRRGRTRPLAGTLVVALLALSGIAAAGWYLDDRGLLALGPGAGGPLAEPLQVGAADGWVAIPPASGVARVVADGTFRVRLAGNVYTGDATRSLRVPMTDGFAVRASREPTVATVTRAEPDDG